MVLAQQELSSSSSSLLLFFLVLALLSSPSCPHPEPPTLGPIIGIFAQPSRSTQSGCGGQCEYLAGSYVKLVESAGGRVIPIPYNASEAYVDQLMKGLNGLLLPGGSNGPSLAAMNMIHRAITINKGGDYFPVLGICLGLEWLMVTLGGEDFKLDGPYDAENISLPLDLTEQAYKSRLWEGASPDLLKIVSNLNVTMNNHHYGASPHHFLSTPALANRFDILSTNTDRQGLPFVSTIEGQDGLPVWGLQWHPEKNVWEWGKQGGVAYEAINHTPEAQEVTHYIADFFLSHARKNRHSFPADIEETLLIYNFSPVRSGAEFVESYYFKW